MTCARSWAGTTTSRRTPRSRASRSRSRRPALHDRPGAVGPADLGCRRPPGVQHGARVRRPDRALGDPDPRGAGGQRPAGRTAKRWRRSRPRSVASHQPRGLGLNNPTQDHPPRDPMTTPSRPSNMRDTERMTEVVVRPAAEPDRERWAELYRGYAAFYEVPAPDLDHLWRRITELDESSASWPTSTATWSASRTSARSRGRSRATGAGSSTTCSSTPRARHRGRRGAARAPALPRRGARLGRGHLDHRRRQPRRPAALRPAGGGATVGHLRHGARPEAQQK